jgi:cytosine/uracil/thiamine/allantoin permease
MNAWPFIIASYGITLGGALGILLWSYGAMRRAEAKVDALRERS